MCGVAGIIGGNTSRIGEMMTALRHRGPDNQNTVVYEKENIAFAHTRLAIIDPDPRSNQPFVSHCGRYVLTYNGEIYNYYELRSDLKRRGYTFDTDSDTEVLLKLLIHSDVDCLNSLDGMFAFCFLDKTNNRAIVARDQIGEKPLYYATGRNGEFAFASEIYPLRKLDWVDRQLNMDAVKNYLLFMYTPAPDTLLNGIKELPPGHYIEIDTRENSYAITRYYDIEESIGKYTFSNESDAIAAITESMETLVARRLRSDVPVGIYLSGGLDSNVIASTALKVGSSRLDSYTMSYSRDAEASEYDESNLASACARYYGVSNRRIDLDTRRNFVEEAKKSVMIFGQPFGNSTSTVAERLAEAVVSDKKVCLVGDGGDELFIGYPRHKALLLRERLERLPGTLLYALSVVVGTMRERGKLATRLRRARQFLEARGQSTAEAYVGWNIHCDAEKLNAAIGCTGASAFQAQLIDIFDRYGSDPLLAASIVDLKSFVPYNLMQCADRTSMHHSLELRCPLLARELIDVMVNVPSEYKVKRGVNKPLLVKGFQEALPPFILTRKKKYFNPPMRSFVAAHLEDIREILMGNDSEVKQLLGREFVFQEIESFSNGTRDNTKFLWGLSTMELWLRP